MMLLFMTYIVLEVETTLLCHHNKSSLGSSVQIYTYVYKT